LKKRKKISVCIAIASLGRPSLFSTLKSLNSILSKNSKIIVCLPASEKNKFSKKKINKCKFIFSKIKNQVSQRVEAFRKARHKFVLQLDDDVRLDTNCLCHLQKALVALGPGHAISPIMVWEHNGLMTDLSQKTFAWRVLKQYLGKSLRIIPGAITHLGTNPAVEITKNTPKLIETEWLPGGCVLHYKKNLILKNYYPFSGKAFSEDVMHSILLRQKGIRLFVNPKAKVFLRKDPPIATIRAKAACVMAESRARKHILRMLGRQQILEQIYTTALIIALPIRHWVSRLFSGST